MVVFSDSEDEDENEINTHLAQLTDHATSQGASIDTKNNEQEHLIENVKLQKTTFSKEDALLIHEFGPNSQEETNEEQLIKMLKNEGFYQSV